MPPRPGGGVAVPTIEPAPGTAPPGVNGAPEFTDPTEPTLAPMEPTDPTPPTGTPTAAGMRLNSDDDDTGVAGD